MDDTDYEFDPQIGMRTEDSYLHGIGDDCMTIGQPGVIEAVGSDWFVYRVEDYGPIFVKRESYAHIERNDFK